MRAQAPFYIIAALLLAQACKPHSLDKASWDNPFPGQKMNRTLQLAGHKKFPLDSSVSLRYGLIQYSEKKNLLIGFNQFDNSFVFFDYNTSALIKKIKLPKDPVTGVGTYSNVFAYSFLFINYDSILLFNRTKGKLYLVDSSATIKRSYSVKPIDRSYTQPGGAFGELLFYARNKVFISAAPGRDIYNTNSSLRSNLVAILDLRSGGISLKLRYPELYGKAFWGEHLHMVYSAFNPDKGCFVYSFPIDHYLYVDSGDCVNATGAYKKVYAGSKDVVHVDPVSFDQGTVKPDEKKEVSNLLNQRTYTQILYDQYAHVYYRFVSAKDLGYGKKTNFSIVILDENLQKIGEQELDSKIYQSTSLVITKDGLCLTRKSNNEDELSYDIFKLGS
jgi:hypothetical protein